MKLFEIAHRHDLTLFCQKSLEEAVVLEDKFHWLTLARFTTDTENKIQVKYEFYIQRVNGRYEYWIAAASMGHRLGHIEVGSYEFTGTVPERMELFLSMPKTKEFFARTERKVRPGKTTKLVQVDPDDDQADAMAFELDAVFQRYGYVPVAPIEVKKIS